MDYKKVYEEWLTNPFFDEETKAELKAIENDENEIKERFFSELEFGTAGLRGVIGAGTNRMNKYVVARATQGLANYIISKGGQDKGVAIALLAVPEAQIKNDDQKVTLNSTTMIRLVLDKAADVNEAIDLMKSYNIYFSGDIDCHYLIADSTGKSVLVEYYDNALQVVEADTSYQIASNFIAFNDLRIGEGYTEFERYDTVEETIRNHRNSLSAENAMDLLNEVGVYDTDGTDKLQWSVVYNLTEKTGRIWAHRNTDNLFEFTLDRHS